MKVSQLIKSLEDYHLYTDLRDFEVRGISCDSKKIGDNFVFVAIKGVGADGHSFIQEAIKKGARAVVLESVPPGLQSAQAISLVTVADTRKAVARLAAVFYGDPSSKMNVVGITGTNGKTTISYLIEAILKEKGAVPSVVGTVNYRFKEKVFPSVNTTPGPLELEALLASMVSEGVGYLVMEVSSHALTQERTSGIRFSAAVFTNLTQDHLDYHRTMEEYFQAKAKIFQALDSGALAVINSDDEYGRRLKGLTHARVITYGIDTPADVTARQIKFSASQTEFILNIAKQDTHLKTWLIGRHNVYNMLAAIAWAFKEGIDLSVIRSALENFQRVPGRLEKVNFGQGFSVFVDYAHTEDALKNVITTLKQLPFGKLIVVFGCGGERDKTKRPKMGSVVTELADYAVITSDNPRSEDPRAIIEDILKGVHGNNYCVIPDRKEAIHKALSMAASADAVLVAGKGHENYQVLKDGKIHFDDREVIEECIKSLNC